MKEMTEISMKYQQQRQKYQWITIPQEKLICSKVGTTNTSKFQQEIIPILKRDIQNFRGVSLKNHLTKWKNITSDEIILDITENRVKLYLI